MGNKDLDKKQLRISSSGTDTECIEAAQDGDYRYIKMMLKEYHSHTKAYSYQRWY